MLLLLAEVWARPRSRTGFLAWSTATSDIARICTRLGAANRAQALVTAMRSGLLSSVGPPH